VDEFQDTAFLQGSGQQRQPTARGFLGADEILSFATAVLAIPSPLCYNRRVASDWTIRRGRGRNRFQAPRDFPLLSRYLLMLCRCVALLVACSWLAAPAFAESLTLVKDKSKIEFTGKKPDGAHKGGFKEFKSEANAEVDAPERSSLKLEIMTDSLWSDDEKLTTHLKNPDFFDVKKFPKIVFETTAIEGAGSDSAVLVGKLTMLEKTAELRVPCKTSVNGESIVLQADFKLDRTKWGMAYGKGKINDEVEIKATLHFER